MNTLFCFTSDIEWAPESMIEETLKVFSDYNVPLTPFITHHSDSIKKHYAGEKARCVGLHPNFLIDSTHGKTMDEVVSHVTGLWEGAVCFRSHCYADNLLITQAFRDKGFKYDSNICLNLQPNIEPLQHASGLLRFPVFLEDIIFVGNNKNWELPRQLDTAGLKIFNFHPIHVCLNTPSPEYYWQVRKQVYGGEDWKKLIFNGKGTRTFLEQLLAYVQGKQLYYLDDLYRLSHQDYVGVWAGKNLLTDYDKATVEGKAKILRKVMDEADAYKTYATSPDFNLRELEIKFIIENIPDTSPKILDIGCGNGYTDLCIAKTIYADITGMDYSAKMIEGAKHLRRNARLWSSPKFVVGDATKLDYQPETFDVVISERMLLNLPDRETQFNVIKDVYRILKKGGLFIMVEGTRNGLRRLNTARRDMGLEEIPDVSETNVSSLKFEEDELEQLLGRYFITLEKQYWGMYYLISRIVHPLLVAPDKPRFDSKINEVARKIAEHHPDCDRMGHLVGYKLGKVL